MLKTRGYQTTSKTKTPKRDYTFMNRRQGQKINGTIKQKPKGKKGLDRLIYKLTDQL